MLVLPGAALTDFLKNLKDQQKHTYIELYFTKTDLHIHKKFYLSISVKYLSIKYS